MNQRFERCAAASYLAAVFVYCFAGVGPGRILLGVTTIWWLLHLVQTRTWPELPAVGGWAFAYSAWVSLALIWGPTDEFSANQVYKHAAWLNIPIAYALVRGTERRRWLIWGLAAGGVVLSIRIFTKMLGIWRQGVAEGLVVDQGRIWERIWLHVHLDGSDLIGRMVGSGGMQDGQRVAVTLIACLIALILAWPGKARWTWLVALMLSIAGVMLSFKRGPWVSLTLLAVVALGASTWRYPLRRSIFWSLLAGALVWSSLKWMPEGPAQAWSDGQTSIQQAIPKGGRVCMWFQVTPELVKEYPWGIGYKALDGHMMREISRHIPPHQSHVHSNPLQAAVDGGWVGLLLFLGWAAVAFRDVFRYLRGTAAGSDEHWLAWGLFGMFCTLFLIGFVEYQLGSGQITMLYGTLMGATAAAVREQRGLQSA